MSEQPLILIIDDDPQNLKLLNFTLSEAGYRVALANGGLVALEALQRRKPDLILCDIVMPEMDGYEVCRALKADPELHEIPLIFLTAQTDTQHLLAGFQAGAVDYVTKPFSQAEVLARVRTHTELKRARDTIMANNQQLQTLNRHLAALNQEKNHFLAIAAHDLKNPLTTVLLRAEMAEENLESPEPGQLRNHLQNIQKDVERMRLIVTNLLDINRIEAGSFEIKPAAFDLLQLVQRLTEQYRDTAARKQIRLCTDLPQGPVTLVADEQLVYQIADNLLSNAIKYSPPGKDVSLLVSATGPSLEIQDQGPGFSAEDKARMFQKFTRLSARPTAGETSTGLGLSIVRMLANLLEAGIDCESQPGAGARFRVRFRDREAVV